MEAFDLVPWIVFFPAIGLLLNAVIGRRVGERGTALIAIGASAAAFVVSVLQFVSLNAHPEGAVVRLAD